MQFSSASVTPYWTMTTSVTVIFIALLWTGFPPTAGAPQVQGITATTEPPRRMGFRSYLAELSRINNEVTSAAARGDHERVNQLAKRLEELRLQFERQNREDEQQKRWRQQEANQRASEERQRRQEVDAQQNRRRLEDKKKSERGPTALYVVIGIIVLIGACVALVKICGSSGSDSSPSHPHRQYGRPEPAPVTTTFNYDTTASGGFNLRANDYTYTPATSPSSTARAASPSPSATRARSSSPRFRPTEAQVTRTADESDTLAPSAPLLNPEQQQGPRDMYAPPSYEDAIRSSPQPHPVRAPSTEEGPPPFDPEFDKRL